MRYNILKKTIGVKSINDFVSFSSSEEIKDMCCADKYGLFMIAGHQIIHIDDKKQINFRWTGKGCGERFGTLTASRFNYPSSICYVPEKEILVIAENNGECVRQIEMKRRFSTSLVDSTSREELKKRFAKTVEKDKTGVCCFGNKYYWVSRMSHQCFSDEKANPFFAGNGYAGYSVAGELKNCQFSFPSDICANNHAIFICDSGNACIRKIEHGKVEYYAGKHNGIDLINPVGIASDRNNKTIYVIDEKKVLAINCYGESVKSNVIYEGNVIAVDAGEKELFIMGVDNA